MVTKISQKKLGLSDPSPHSGLSHKKQFFSRSSLLQLILMFVMAFSKGCTKCSTGVVASIFPGSTLIPSSNPSRSHSRGIPIHHSRNIRSEHRPLVGASVLQLAQGGRPRLSFSFHTSPCTRGNHICYSRGGVQAGRLFYDDGGDDRS